MRDAVCFPEPQFSSTPGLLTLTDIHRPQVKVRTPFLTS